MIRLYSPVVRGPVAPPGCQARPASAAWALNPKPAGEAAHQAVSICLAARCRAFLLLPGCCCACFRALGAGGAGGSVAARWAVTAATGSALNCGCARTCCSRTVSLSLQPTHDQVLDYLTRCFWTESA